MIERFVEAGYSKFVMLPATPVEDMTDELELVAQELLPLEN